MSPALSNCRVSSSSAPSMNCSSLLMHMTCMPPSANSTNPPYGTAILPPATGLMAIAPSSFMEDSCSSTVPQAGEVAPIRASSSVPLLVIVMKKAPVVATLGDGRPQASDISMPPPWRQAKVAVPSAIARTTRAQREVIRFTFSSGSRFDHPRCLTSSQHVLQVGSDGVGSGSVADHQLQVAFLVYHVEGGTVIDQIAGGAFFGVRFIPDPERRGDTAHLIVGAGYPDESGVEELDVLGQLLGVIAGRIDRDHDQLDILGLVSQLGESLVHIREGGRAHIGAERVTEVEHHQLAPVIAEADRPVGRSEGEVGRRQLGLNYRPVELVGAQPGQHQPGEQGEDHRDTQHDGEQAADWWGGRGFPGVSHGE